MLDDDAIDSALTVLRGKLRERELARQQPHSSKRITREENYERKIVRILEDPNVSAREMEDLLDVLKEEYAKYGREAPNLYTSSLKKKIELAGVPRTKNNRGGRPATHDWEGAIIAVLAAVYDGKLQPEDRQAVGDFIMDWLAQHRFEGPPSSPTHVREIARRIREAVQEAVE